MEYMATIIGGGLAGSEAALQLASRGVHVRLVEMRPETPTPVHVGGGLAELVCSNSLKSMKPDKPAGMLKYEMAMLGSYLLECAFRAQVPAGGALAVDREVFSRAVDALVGESPLIERIAGEALDIRGTTVEYRPAGAAETAFLEADAVIIATGPLTSDGLAPCLERITGTGHLAFFDAAAPIVMAESIDGEVLFRQSRYGDEGEGDYLNAPFTKEEYDSFITELLDAKRVIAHDFETKELFSACQPIEEIARRGFDAPRHGMMKPVGLTDPRTGRRPYAAVQLRAEDVHGSSYNLVGFQTNLTFPEQARVFRMIPGLERAEFARYGVMHRNTFIDAPHLVDAGMRLKGTDDAVYFAGQVSGTEGYCEAIMSGLYAALNVYAQMRGIDIAPIPSTTSFGSLIAYATDERTAGYQPMHVNFGVFPPLENQPRGKDQRYRAFLKRERADMRGYVEKLEEAGLVRGERGSVLSLWEGALKSAGMQPQVEDEAGNAR